MPKKPRKSKYEIPMIVVSLILMLMSVVCEARGHHAHAIISLMWVIILNQIRAEKE